jgi:acyl-CoA synthetase (AMP-forming)/AMP-acid ligase II
MSTVPRTYATFVDVLGTRAARSAGLAVEVIDADGAVRAAIGYPELEERARAIGAALAGRGLTGQRVLVPLPVGVEYVTALLGCFYAGAVAIPLPAGPSARRVQVLVDAEPTAAIVSPGTDTTRFAAHGVDLVSTVELAGGTPWRRPEIGPDTLALLQYAPGSAAHGVMVSHANLVAAASQLAGHVGMREDTGVVSFLSPYHDLGLVGGVLAPILAGARVTLLASDASPELWLRTVSSRRARISFAPELAYAWRADREYDALDLSAWDVAVTSAGPETLDRFADRLAPHGFRRGAFFPGYWSSEATALVAGRRGAEVTGFDADSLEPGRLTKPGGTALIDRGRAVADLDIAIVDPLTATRCADGTAGEVWVSGPNVAVGYLGRPDESERTFCARLRGSKENYLRTGELGFVHNGGLHLAQRQDVLLAS